MFTYLQRSWKRMRRLWGMSCALAAFCRGNYTACVRHGLPLLRLGASLDALQVLLISLRRRGRLDELSRAGPQVLAMTERRAFEHATVRLTLDLADPSEVYALAATELQRCEAHFYVGAWLLTVGNLEAARLALVTCNATDVRTSIKLLARAELRTLSWDEPKSITEYVRQYLTFLNEGSVEMYGKGRYREAITFAGRIRDMARQFLGETDPAYAAFLSNLANGYRATADHAAAEPLLRQALELLEAVPGQEADLARCVGNLAEVYRETGDFARAEPLCRRALEILGRSVGPDHPDYATALNNLALVCWSLRSPSRAEPLFRQALAILPPASPQYCGTLNNLGQLYHEMGADDRAETLFRGADELYRTAVGPNHPDHALILLSLARLRGARGSYAEAEALLQQALNVCRATVGDGHPTFGRLLNYLGLLYLDTGNLDRAEPVLLQSMEVNQAALGERHPFLAACQINVALMHAARGRPAEALRLMDVAAGIEGHLISQAFMSGSEARRLECLRRGRATVSYLLSLALRHAGTVDGAVASAFRLVLRRKGLAAGAEEARRDAVLGGRYSQLLPYFQKLTALRRQFARKALAGPGPEGVGAHEATLEEWAEELQELDMELSLRVPEMDLRVRLWWVDQEAVAEALPEGSALVEFIHFFVHDFHAVAARGEAVWNPARYAALVLPAGKPDGVALIDLGEAGDIDRLVAGFRSGITREAEARQRPGDDAPEVVLGGGPVEGERLRQAVFDPLREALGGRTQLVLAPDGDLNRLPFETLPDRDGRHLLDRYRVSYVATGRDVLRFGMEPHGRASFPVVVAAPDYDLGADPAHAAPGNPERASFQPLPATRAEGERVAELLSDNLWTELPPWLGGEALEARLKGVRSPWVLHLATHGFFLPDPPVALPRDPGEDSAAVGVDPLEARPLLRSGVALAGANGNARGFTPPEDAEDGLLTAEDVTGMDLLDTDLVVLSACETALGSVEVGEGVFGLRRAFVLAGARALVMSLWKVPDLATAVLMERLYHNLLARGLGRAEALRDAQASTRDVTVGELRASWLTTERIDRLAAGSERRKQSLQRLAGRPDDYRPFGHPRYWGAFICQGDPGPLNRDMAPPHAAGPGSTVVPRKGGIQSSIGLAEAD